MPSSPASSGLAEAQGHLAGIIQALYARAGIDEAVDSRLGRMLLVSRPGQVDAVARAPELFAKNFSLISSLGISRFNTNGEEWAIRRAITQPSYLEAARSHNLPAIAAIYRDALAGFTPERPGALQQALFEASMAVFHAALGAAAAVPPAARMLDRVRDQVRLLQYHSWVRAAPDRLQRLIGETRFLVAEFAALLGGDPALAGLRDRLAAGGREVAGFSPAEEYVMNLFAGVETTVATILWAIDRLAALPETQERIAAELATAEPQQARLEVFINETMRCFPAIPFLIREVTEDTGLEDVGLKRGELLMVSIIGVHRHPSAWETPQSFDPERRAFHDDSYDRRAFIPFLTGPRMCGGARLARVEIREALKAFLSRWRVERRGEGIAFDYALALRPTGIDRLILNRR